MKRIKELFIIFTCLLVWAVLLSGWTYTLNTSTPGTTDDPREADDRMREIKGAFVERLDIDHYFTASATSIYDAADTGKHKQVTYQAVLAAHPTVASGEAQTYIKTVGSQEEYHWRDDTNSGLQLTSAGTLNITSADLLGTLAADTYFTDANSVDLIKGDPNGAAVIPDGSKTATNGAPTLSMGIANKKYVDDEIDARVGTAGDASPAAVGAATQSVTLPNGLIMKFGEESVAGNTTDEVTYGTAFATGVYSAVCSYKSTSAALSECAVCTPKSGSETTILQVTNGMNATQTISWIVIGY